MIQVGEEIFQVLRVLLLIYRLARLWISRRYVTEQQYLGKNTLFSILRRANLSPLFLSWCKFSSRTIGSLLLAIARIFKLCNTVVQHSQFHEVKFSRAATENFTRVGKHSILWVLSIISRHKYCSVFVIYWIPKKIE